MGEKITRIYVGALQEDLPPCPNEDGWHEFLYNLDGREKLSESWRRGLNGVRFGTSYESTPAWLGFCVVEMEYQEVWLPSSGDEEYNKAHEAWRQLKELLAPQGINLPAPKIIVAHDE